MDGREAGRRNGGRHPEGAASPERSCERGSMTRNRSLLFAVSALFVLLFAVVGTQAAEEGANSATERATEIFKWINFAVVAGVVVCVFGKLLPPVFRKKAEAGRSAITKAPSSKAVAY